MTTTFPRWPARVYLCAATRRTRRDSVRYVFVYSSKESAVVDTISDCQGGFGGGWTERIFGQEALSILGEERNFSQPQPSERVAWRPCAGSVLHLQGGGRTYCRLWRQRRFLSCAPELSVGLRGYRVENYLLDESATRRPLFRISARNRPSAGAMPAASDFLD